MKPFIYYWCWIGLFVLNLNIILAQNSLSFAVNIYSKSILDNNYFFKYEIDVISNNTESLNQPEMIQQHFITLESKFKRKCASALNQKN